VWFRHDEHEGNGMLEDRFPSLEEMAIQAWKDRFFNFIILPFSLTFAIFGSVKRSYYKTFNLLFFYLSKGTFYDIESDMD
jgi:hypothetical protein